MAFNRHQLESLLGAYSQTPLNLSFYIFETLPSTNQTLWELIDQGAAPGTVVIAEQQTAGKGQWGRQWQSSVGGLYLSMAFAPNLPATNAAGLTISSAWGIATELRRHGIPVLIKWPNDLVLEGRKLGGILTETRVNKGQITTAIVGVGINWANPVPETGINLQSFFQEAGVSTISLEWEDKKAPKTPPVTSLEMLGAIAIQGLLSGYQHAQPEKIDTLLPYYLELLSSQGHSVVVDGRPGVVVGVTSTGELRVRLDSSADVEEICLQPGTINLGYSILPTGKNPRFLKQN